MFLPARPCLHTPLTSRNLIRLLEFHSSIYTTGDRLWARRLWLHTFLSFRCLFAPPTKSPRRQNLHPGKRDKRSGNFPTPDSFLCGAETDPVLPTRNIKNQQLGSQNHQHESSVMVFSWQLGAITSRMHPARSLVTYTTGSVAASHSSSDPSAANLQEC